MGKGAENQSLCKCASNKNCLEIHGGGRGNRNKTRMAFGSGRHVSWHLACSAPRAALGLPVLQVCDQSHLPGPA